MSPSALFVTTVPITLEAFLVPLAENFRAKGWTVDALANGASGHAPIDEAFDHRYDVAWSRSAISPGNFFGARSRMRDVVASGAYDVVHVHTPIAAYVTRAALSRVKGPNRPSVIYTAHGFHFFEGNSPAKNAVFHAMERRAARWTDVLVTINDEDYRAAQRFDTIEPGHVRLIPGIGVDSDRYRPDRIDDGARQALRQALSVPDDAFLVAMVAEFAPVKRHAHLIEALAAADDRVHVALIGTGPLESAIRERTLALGLTERVHFAGYRRDVADLLVACDALTLVSEREGLARSVLEGMSCGLPVIGTDTRGIADAVTPDTGWIVPKDDTGALAGAFTAAAADPAEAARRGRMGRERVLARFEQGLIISAYEEVYRDALASRV